MSAFCATSSQAPTNAVNLCADYGADRTGFALVDDAIEAAIQAAKDYPERRRVFFPAVLDNQNGVTPFGKIE